MYRSPRNIPSKNEQEFKKKDKESKKKARRSHLVVLKLSIALKLKATRVQGHETHAHTFKIISPDWQARYRHGRW